MVICPSENIIKPPPPARHFNVPRSHPGDDIGRDNLVTATGGILSLLHPRRKRTATELWDSGALQFSAT